MSIMLYDEGNEFSSGIFTGTIITTAERKQAVSKRSGKYSEFVELVVQFRPKEYQDDVSCYISLRIYSQKNADLALRLRRGAQVFGFVTVASDRVIRWQNDRVRLFGNATFLIPMGEILSLLIESFERKQYKYELAMYKPDPNKIDYTGDEDKTGRDVVF